MSQDIYCKKKHANKLFFTREKYNTTKSHDNLLVVLFFKMCYFNILKDDCQYINLSYSLYSEQQKFMQFFCFFVFGIHYWWKATDSNLLLVLKLNILYFSTHLIIIAISVQIVLKLNCTWCWWWWSSSSAMSTGMGNIAPGQPVLQENEISCADFFFLMPWCSTSKNLLLFG